MSRKQKEITVFVKNMVCHCCVRVIKDELEKNGIVVKRIELGRIELAYNSEEISLERIAEILEENGFEIIVERERKIVEQIKLAVIELVHYLNNVDSIVRKSDYLVGKLGMSYQQMSKIFSKYESVTLEKFIILNKIERIKELINSDEYTLSEIAYMMDYSSVQYLSNQFKNITGMSVSDYKKEIYPTRKSLNELY